MKAMNIFSKSEGVPFEIVGKYDKQNNKFQFTQLKYNNNSNPEVKKKFAELIEKNKFGPLSFNEISNVFYPTTHTNPSFDSDTQIQPVVSNANQSVIPSGNEPIVSSSDVEIHVDESEIPVDESNTDDANLFRASAAPYDGAVDLLSLQQSNNSSPNDKVLFHGEEDVFGELDSNSNKPQQNVDGSSSTSNIVNNADITNSQSKSKFNISNTLNPKSKGGKPRKQTRKNRVSKRRTIRRR